MVGRPIKNTGQHSQYGNGAEERGAVHDGTIRHDGMTQGAKECGHGSRRHVTVWQNIVTGS